MRRNAFQIDLQLHTGATHRLSDASINELSLVFAEKNGQTWAPRNPEARVLGVKAAAIVDNPASTAIATKGFLGALMERVTKGWLVKDGVPDNIDGDGDGAQDYETIVGLITSLYYDISSCYGIGDDDARSMAICVAIDNFLKNLDDVRDGGDGDVTRKAGAKHSKKTKAALSKIDEHAKAISGAIASMTDDGDGADDGDEAAGTGKAGVVTPTAAVDNGGAAVVETPPAAATKADVAAATPELGETIVTQIGGLLDAFKAQIATQLEVSAKATDDKIAAIATDVAAVTVKADSAVATQSTALQNSVKAIETARQPSASGGLGVVGTDGTVKGAATVVQPDQSAAGSRLFQAVKASLASAETTVI